MQAIGEADGLRIEHIDADWMLDRLQGTKFVNGRVFGRTTKAGEFKARTTWTPGAVLDYLRRATRVEWQTIRATLKEQTKAEKANK